MAGRVERARSQRRRRRRLDPTNTAGCRCCRCMWCCLHAVAHPRTSHARGFFAGARRVHHACCMHAPHVCSVIMAAAASWATSLAQATRARLPGLRLHGSPELVCANMMCDRVGQTCLCRLSMCLERMHHLRHLDLRGNQLQRLPEVWRLPELETLDVRDNLLGAHDTAPRRRALASSHPVCPRTRSPCVRRGAPRGARLDALAARAARRRQPARSDTGRGAAADPGSTAGPDIVAGRHGRARGRTHTNIESSPSSAVFNT